MNRREYYLDPRQRAALERRMFEAARDVLYAEGKASSGLSPGSPVANEPRLREAFDRHMERDWPAFRRQMRLLSDARLEDHLADAVERLDALGLKQMAAKRQPPLAPSPVDHLTRDQYEDALDAAEANGIARHEAASAPPPTVGKRR
ncbi:MAG: hypothetical protein U0871_04770 [Gemmataceae bacterium]